MSIKYTLTIKGDPAELVEVLTALHVAGKAKEALPPSESAEKPEPAPEAPSEPAKPAEGGVPSPEDLRSAAMRAIDDGKRAEVSELLKQHGAKRITDLPESERAAFLVEVEAL